MDRPVHLGVATIGYAFMGKAHSNAWRNVASFFDVPAFEQKVLVGPPRQNHSASGTAYVSVGRGSGPVRSCSNEAQNVMRRSERGPYVMGRQRVALFVILIPIIAGSVLHATRAPCAAHDPKFRSALPRHLFPHETLNRSRFPKLHSGPSNPAVTPLPEQRTNLTNTSGARQPLKEKKPGTAHHQNPIRGDQATHPGPRHDGRK
jgi:hypothetical protein